MNFHTINLGLDGSIQAQKALQARVDFSLDLQKLDDQLRLWASRLGVTTLRHSLSALRSASSLPWLTFLGSGDFHHVSALLLETIPDFYKPLHLVLIDNHPDWFNLPPRFHCGNWLSTALKLGWLKSATLIGQDSDDLASGNYLFAPFSELESGRVSVFPHSRESAFVPLRYPPVVHGVRASRRSMMGVQLHFDTVKNTGVRELASIISSRLKGQNVYFSIDKDAMIQRDAVTDWDQGRLSLKEVIDLISTISHKVRVVGVDVCGDTAPAPLKGILKRLDSERFWHGQFRDWDNANTTNERSNLALHEAVRSIFRQTTPARLRELHQEPAAI
jgi:arginase family enzyme